MSNISKRVINLIFLNIYTPPPHALTCVILFQLIYLIKQQKVFSFHTSTIACVILLFLPVFTFSFVFLFHLWLSLMLPCYFISIQHTLHHPSSFHLLFSLYLTLIISMFYCLNYTWLLLYLIITQLVNMFYTNYVINVCPRQLLWFT